MAARLSLIWRAQVSISGQALVFVVRTPGWSPIMRAGMLTYIAFFAAQVPVLAPVVFERPAAPASGASCHLLGSYIAVLAAPRAQYVPPQAHVVEGPSRGTCQAGACLRHGARPPHANACHMLC